MLKMALAERGLSATQVDTTHLSQRVNDAMTSTARRITHHETAPFNLVEAAD